MRVFDRAVVRVLPALPRQLVRRLSAPYIAGPSLEHARRTVAALNAQGKRATIDVLGEEIVHREEAEAIAQTYHDVLAALEVSRLDASISVKLTGLGLEIDPDHCRLLLEKIVRDAASRRRFVRIDMEDSSTTDSTLAFYRELCASGFDNVGIVLQAYLKRTLADIEALSDLRPSVRLCKGIYLEPEAITFHDPDAVRHSFVACLDALLANRSRVAIATHDEWLLRESLARVASLPRDAYEFQMLLGVREHRATQLVAAGHRVRIYVPFGRHWYEYSLRRLQENPRLAGMLAKTTLRRLARA